MAITRKLLKEMGLSDEQVDTIIEAHAETVDGLKEQIATYKADADKLPGVLKQLDDLKTAGDSDWEERYTKVKQEFDDYKAKQATHAAKETAYRALLRKAGVSDRRIASVLKVSNVDGVELTEEGTIKGADKLIESIQTEWSDFITTTTVEGAKTDTPPANAGKGTMTKDEIMKIKDPVARQNAIGQNLELFRKE